jgi:hypothetical protein
MMSWISAKVTFLILSLLALERLGGQARIGYYPVWS